MVDQRNKDSLTSVIKITTVLFGGCLAHACLSDAAWMEGDAAEALIGVFYKGRQHRWLLNFPKIKKPKKKDCSRADDLLGAYRLE